ncbi:MAG: vitamin B12 dependent-methionine synthase activation domain-containing protein [Bacteroidota bacterium]|nr:vitamin B12 dependent-methionine synthase activation domain-containing protein [Bacteroidota bacterium]
MNYTPVQPTTSGIIQLTDIDLREIVPFIDWTFFFLAWRISGRYEGIETVHDCPSCTMSWLRQFPETDRPKAEEALKLYRDAREMLRRFKEENLLTVNASFGIFPGYAREDDIFIRHNETTVVIPTLRQQHPSTDGFCYSLADFLAPENDYVGVFATTVLGVEEFAASFEKEDNMYDAILVKTLSDRLAEAAAEWLHAEVRRKYWGYASGEDLSVKDMLKTTYQGIRPAVGYPSLPDQSIIFELDPLLKFNDIGITLTENGAMFPNASVCGLYFAHPQSKYFMIGKIDENQFTDYAARRGMKPEALRKWMAANL